MALVEFCRLGCVGGDLSFTAGLPSILRLGGRTGATGFFHSVQRWSSHRSRNEKLAAVQSSSKLPICVEPSSRMKVRRRPGVLFVASASDHLETTTHFFTDELVEANLALQRLAERGQSADRIHSGPTKEVDGTSQCVDGVQDSGKLPDSDLEREYWKGLKGWKGLEMSGRGRLPIESNGPPMVFLQPYLVSGKNSEEQPKEKLRRLPFPEPHKKRPPGLPRPSLRRRLGVAFSRKLFCADISSENPEQVCYRSDGTDGA